MQDIVIGAAQMLTQDLPTSRTGIEPLSRGMGCPTDCKQVAMEPEKFLAPFLTEKASSRLSSRIVWKSDPTGLEAISFRFQVSVATKKPEVVTTLTPQAT